MPALFLFLWIVLHKGDSSLGFYSADRKLEKQAAVNAHPHEMVRSADGKLLYTTDNGTMRIEPAGVGGNTVSIINLAAPTASPVCPTAICSSPPNGAYAHRQPRRPTGPRPEGSILSPDGARPNECQRDGSGIAKIDTATPKWLRALDSPPGPVRVDVSPDGRHVIYSLLDEKAIGWTDTKTRKIVGRVDLAAPLGQIVSLDLSPDGKLAYAANENMDGVYAVDLASRRIVKNWLLPKDFGPDPAMEIH